MENLRNRSIVTNHTTYGRDAGKRLMNQGKNILAFLTDFSQIQDTVRRRKCLDGLKLSVKKGRISLRRSHLEVDESRGLVIQINVESTIE